MLPELVVKKKDRTPEWGEKVALSIVQMCLTTAQMQDRLAKEHLDGQWAKGDFDYMTKVYGLDRELPAKMRHIPMVKKHLNAMLGEEALREINFRTYSIDSDTVSMRRKEMGEAIIKDLNAIMLQAQRKKLEAVRNGQPDPSSYFIEREIEKLQKYYKYTYQSTLEISTQKATRYLIQRLKLKNIKNKLFKDKCVNGKQLWKVEARPGKDPVVRRVKPENFYYAPNSNDPWIKNSDWCVEEVFMSPTEILDRWNGKLNEKQIARLKAMATEYASMASSYYGSDKVLDIDGTYDASLAFNTGSRVYRGTMDPFSKVRVCYVEWIVNREIKEKITKKKGKREDNIIQTKLMKDTYVPVDSEKNQVITKYVQDRFEAAVIGQGMVVDFKKSDNVVRDEDNPTKATLSYNGINDEFSLTESVMDMQLLYNLLFYHKEAMLALSGSRGMVYDLAQKPDDYTLEEVLYYKKLGLMLINSAQKGAKSQTGYNQFQAYDDTLPQAIEILEGMIRDLDNLTGDVMGVPPQRRGAVKTDEGLGNNEMALDKSNTVTATIFKEHDEAFRELMCDMTNACKVSWKDGKKGQYVLNDYEMDMFTLRKGELDNTTLGVFFSDNQTETKKIQELRQAATQAASRSMQETGITFGDLVKIFSKDNLREIQIEVDEAIEKRQQQMDQANQQTQMAQQQADQEKVKAEQEKFAKESAQKDRELELTDKDISLKYGVERDKMANTKDTEEKKISLDKERLGLEKMQLQIAGTKGNAAEVRNN
jgi:hypothetical protein